VVGKATQQAWDYDARMKGCRWDLAFRVFAYEVNWGTVKVFL
jgi:hypothetical protein